MRLQQVLAVISLSEVALAVPTKFNADALVRRQYPVMECSHLTGGLHVIAGAGSNSADPKSYGYLGSLATSILNAIPGSTNVSLPYDKLTTKTNPNAIPDGMSTLKAYVEQYHSACPNTKIALIGYSSGAVIVMNSLCQGLIDPALSGSYIVGTVVYGDETRTAGTPYDLGTCTGSGKSPRDPNSCYPFADNMQSYCDEGDPECCVPGTDPNVHFVYPKYDSQATQFIVDKFNAAGGA